MYILHTYTYSYTYIHIKLDLQGIDREPSHACCVISRLILYEVRDTNIRVPNRLHNVTVTVTEMVTVTVTVTVTVMVTVAVSVF